VTPVVWAVLAAVHQLPVAQKQAPRHARVAGVIPTCGFTCRCCNARIVSRAHCRHCGSWSPAGRRAPDADTRIVAVLIAVAVGAVAALLAADWVQTVITAVTR